jgi:hypothetical protein
MKKHVIFNILIMLLFTACYDRDEVYMGEIVDPVLSNNLDNSSFILTEENLEDPFASFNWTAAEFGFDHRNPEYVLRMDLEGNNFTNSISLGTTREHQHTVLNSRINQNLLTLGAEPGEKVSVQFKLFASISADIRAESNVVRVELTAMDVVIDFPKLYIAGDHNGWSFTDMIYSVQSNNVYTGYVWMDNDGQWNKFKMSMVPGWVEEYVIGDPNANGTSGTLQVGNWGGNNIVVQGDAGYYFIKADLNQLYYQFYVTEWAVTGDFNGWSFTPMQFDKVTNTWKLTADITSGGFKFIANENWSLVYGDDEQNGLLDPGHDGNNIMIEENGNYTITLNLHEPPYNYTIVKN